MAKDIPVRQHLKDNKVGNYSDVIRSNRLSNNMTQNMLAQAVGSWTRKEGMSIVSEWETGFSLPGLKNIYNISETLNIDREGFFRVILREHFDRFTDRHYHIYTHYLQTNEFIDGRYYFITKGKIQYSFPKFVSIIKPLFKKKGITQLELVKRLRSNGAFEVRRGYLSQIFSGKKCPGVRTVIGLAKYFKIEPFTLYKVVVEEKALAHAKNMMLQWELYKEERKNEARDNQDNQNDRREVA
jgi:transcriptional regulator with XRE-family HTH domain